MQKLSENGHKTKESVKAAFKRSLSKATKAFDTVKHAGETYNKVLSRHDGKVENLLWWDPLANIHRWLSKHNPSPAFHRLFGYSPYRAKAELESKLFSSDSEDEHLDVKHVCGERLPGQWTKTTFLAINKDSDARANYSLIPWQHRFLCRGFSDQIEVQLNMEDEASGYSVPLSSEVTKAMCK